MLHKYDPQRDPQKHKTSDNLAHKIVDLDLFDPNLINLPSVW